MLDKTLFQVSVKETTKNFDYWASRPWLSAATSASVRSSQLVIVPWEDFRQDNPILFPNGTTDWFELLREKLVIQIAAEEENYKEIALHANIWRIPTILLTAVALPVFTQILADQIQQKYFQHSDDQLEMRVIVNGENGACIEIDYKGPPEKAVDSVLSNATKYCGALNNKAFSERDKKPTKK